MQDPGNVGTIIRTADAAGFTGVIVSDKSADIYSLKTLRSMQGSHFHLPIYQMSSQALLKETKETAIPVLATTLSKVSVDYRELPPIENFVLVMGNEGQGISSLMAESADQLVHISMKGQAESLKCCRCSRYFNFPFKLILTFFVIIKESQFIEKEKR